MAIYAFLKLEGIEGESQDSEYKDQIQLLSTSWASSNSNSFHAGTGSSVGKGTISDLQCAKFMDKASLTLMKCCVTGKVIKTGTLSLVKEEDNSKKAYLQVDLTNIVINNYSMAANNGGELPSESLSLSFVKQVAKYLPQADTGEMNLGNVDFSWDIQKQAES